MLTASVSMNLVVKKESEIKWMFNFIHHSHNPINIVCLQIDVVDQFAECEIERSKINCAVFARILHRLCSNIITFIYLFKVLAVKITSLQIMLMLNSQQFIHYSVIGQTELPRIGDAKFYSFTFLFAIS